MSFRSAKGIEVAIGFSEKIFGRSESTEVVSRFHRGGFVRSEFIRGNPRNAEHKTHKAPGREVTDEGG